MGKLDMLIRVLFLDLFNHPVLTACNIVFNLKCQDDYELSDGKDVGEIGHGLFLSPGLFLEGLRKTKIHLIQDGHSLGWDSNCEFPEYEGMLLSILLYHNTFSIYMQETWNKSMSKEIL
jgi:hypothetical protein